MSNPKILIIDDDVRNIFALNAVLTTKGYNCVTATSAESGMKLLSEEKDVGIILLDMMMPEIDGYEAIQIIRNSAFAQIPVIAVTAQAMRGDREKALEAGADEYIPKPVDVDRLMIVLKNLDGEQ